MALLPALALGGLTGCHDASDGNAGTAPPTIASGDDSPTAATSPASAAPSASASPSAPTSQSTAPAATSSTAAAAGLSDRLLGAHQLPGFNDGYAWKEGRTTTQEPRELFGTCQKFEMNAIGATRAAYRSFEPRGRSADSAEQLVVEFPDSTTAHRAWSVLQSWRSDCKSRLKGYRTRQVGDLQDVPLDGGDGAWYLLVYGPAKADPDAGVFDAQGMTIVGRTISLLELKSIGQDYDYPPGQEPMVGAVQVAAASLG